METLYCNTNIPRYNHYSFTDKLTNFFEKAKGLFKAQFNHISFRVLQVKADPSEQGFEAKTYDLIIVSNTIHATKNLDITLANTRKLLRPGGNSSFLKRVYSFVIRTAFTFGVLPGRWLRQVVPE